MTLRHRVLRSERSFHAQLNRAAAGGRTGTHTGLDAHSSHQPADDLTRRLDARLPAPLVRQHPSARAGGSALLELVATSGNGIPRSSADGRVDDLAVDASARDG